MAFIKRPTYVRLESTILKTQEAIRFLDPFWEKEDTLYKCVANEFEIMYLSDIKLLVTFDSNQPKMLEDLSRVYMTYEEAEKLQKRIDELTLLWANAQVKSA